MSLDYNLGNIDDWVRKCYIGLTELPEGEDLDAWLQPHTGWFTAADDSPVGLVAKEEGWLAVHMHPGVEAIIWAGMIMQPSPRNNGSINAKNVEKWIERLTIWETIKGPMSAKFHMKPIPRTKHSGVTHWEDVYITREFVHSLIGLNTNCSTVSDTEFNKKIRAELKSQARNRLRKIDRENPLVFCGNCQWTGRQDDLNEIKDRDQRVDVGEEEPAGECPVCGALAHLAIPVKA